MKLSKWTILVSLFFCTNIVLFSSCSEEWNQWEELSLEIDATQLQDIPYKGDKKTISIQTNTVWEIDVATSSSWIKFNKTSGTEDDVIEVSIEQNSADKSRTGRINITAGKRLTETNIVGQKTKSISFKQHSLYEDQTNSINMRVISATVYRSKYPLNRFYEYTGEIQYALESDRTDISELIKSGKISVRLWGNKYNQWGNMEGNAEYAFDVHIPTPVVLGTNTVTFNYSLIETGIYIRAYFIPSILLKNGLVQQNYRETDVIINQK